MNAHALATRFTPAARDAQAPTVVEERGQRQVFCGLTSIVWLHRKIQDAFFLVIGSRTCAHLIQSAAGVMIFAEPRFATAILEERDLAGMADVDDEIDRVVERLLERRPDIKLLFLVGSCPSEVIKIDLSRAAARLSRRHSPGVRVLSYTGSGVETTFTQGEDMCLAALAPCLPEEPASARALSARRRRARRRRGRPIRPPLRCVGHSADAFPPHAPRRRSSPGRPQHVVSSRSSLLARCGARARKAWREANRRLLPAGQGRDDGLASRGRRRFQRPAREIRSRDGAGRARATAALDKRRATLAGKRVFFFPDSQMEPALARFLLREMSMQLVEVGTPYLHRQHLAQEFALLPSDLLLTEGQSLDDQLDRCRAAKPDLVVCGLGLANPLEAEGFTTKWSIDLLFSPIQGYEQAGDLASLFARPLERRARLEI